MKGDQLIERIETGRAQKSIQNIISMNKALDETTDGLAHLLLLLLHHATMRWINILRCPRTGHYVEGGAIILQCPQQQTTLARAKHGQNLHRHTTHEAGAGRLQLRIHGFEQRQNALVQRITAPMQQRISIHNSTFRLAQATAHTLERDDIHGPQVGNTAATRAPKVSNV